MNFEAAISAKIIDAIKEIASIAASGAAVAVLEFADFQDDYNRAAVVVNVEPRVNICGPLYRVQVTLISNTVSAKDKNRAQLIALDAALADYIEDVKAAPDALSGESDYTVDGAANTDPSPMPELLDISRARIRSFNLFVSYSHTPPSSTP
jgi:hypothetical protein